MRSILTVTRRQSHLSYLENRTFRNVPVTFKWFGLAPEIPAGAVELVLKKAVWALGRVGSRAGQDKDDTPTVRPRFSLVSLEQGPGRPSSPLG